jgi:hypothetical protein
VIIISSIAGYNPEATLGMYGVTKTALFGLTKVYTYPLSLLCWHTPTDSYRNYRELCIGVVSTHFVSLYCPMSTRPQFTVHTDHGSIEQ